MSDALGILFGSLESGFPGIGIVAMIIAGVVFAFKYLIITKFDSIFMNFLDRNTSVVIENIVVLTIFWGAFIFITFMLILVNGNKTLFLAFEIACSVIVMIFVWLYYRNKPDKKAEEKFMIRFYILADAFMVFQTVVNNHQNVNESKITEADIIISFVFALYGLLIKKMTESRIPAKSQYMFIDNDGQEGYMHHIVRDDLVLCSDTGDLSNDNERFLIDIHNIKSIRMVRNMDNMKNDDNSKNGNKPTVVNTGNSGKSPEELYADMVSMIKNNKDKKAGGLIDDCVDVIKNTGQSDIIKIQALADINYNNDNILIMIGLVTILIMMYTFIGTFGGNFDIISSLMIVAIPTIYTIGAMIWMFFETKKRRPYIIICAAIKERKRMLNTSEDI